jgi:YbgC/YbaW family acyl-CoA thioester hydrolase
MIDNNTHRTTLTVRGYELDSYGHVNNAVYLQYFEQARWEYIKHFGLLDKINQHELFLVVVDTHIRYMRESNLFDELEIETDCRIEKPYVVFQQKIINQKNLPVSRATVKTVFVDKQRIPQDIPEFMKNIEQDS